MSISFGPGGKSISFGKRKFPDDLPEYLNKFRLNGYEIECGRGVNISQRSYEELPSIIKKFGIVLSIHAPYYISLSSVKKEIRDNSVKYIFETAKAAKRLGAQKIVVHPGSCGKISREEALSMASETLIKSRKYLDEQGLEEIIICPETMGKINQLGTLDEVLLLCGLSDRILPCIDFGHIHARAHGGLTSESDYKQIFDKIENSLGLENLNNIHIHFSKIAFSKGGEKVHMKFSDREYGPDYIPLINQIVEKRINPSIICESAGTQAEDASKMSKYYYKLIKTRL